MQACALHFEGVQTGVGACAPVSACVGASAGGCMPKRACVCARAWVLAAHAYAPKRLRMQVLHRACAVSFEQRRVYLRRTKVPPWPKARAKSRPPSHKSKSVSGPHCKLALISSPCVCVCVLVCCLWQQQARNAMHRHVGRALLMCLSVVRKEPAVLGHTSVKVSCCALGHVQGVYALPIRQVCCMI